MNPVTKGKSSPSKSEKVISYWLIVIGNEFALEIVNN